MDTEAQTQAIIELTGRFDRLMDGIETVKDRQEVMASDVSKIKEAVYHPDEGIYARIRELEQWKATSTRLIWIIITTLAGAGGSLLVGKLFLQ